jgi:uncharacterized protein YjiS (DUF1127 family)
MTTLQDLQRTISHFVDSRRRRRRLRRELEQLDAMGSLDAVLADIGVVRSQFESLIASDTTEQLDQMQARLGIDATRLPVESRRDMEWTCSQCTDKRRCRQWLSDTDGTSFRDFCPNARQLDDALATQHPAHT